MKTFRFLLLASPFLLSACGEGWEMVRVDNVVPYGNTRTAGSGVAYVRAKMAPKKELVLKPVVRPMTPKPVETKAEKVFEEKQLK